jgi:hypothetical protein
MSILPSNRTERPDDPLWHNGYMCPNCDAFAERLTFWTPADYVAFVRRLIPQVSTGNLFLIYGDCALDELKDAPPWPTGDRILHELQCAQCGQFFQLHVNVWNGRNGWGPQSAEEWADEKHYYIK